MSPRSLPLSLAIALALAGMGSASAWAGSGPVTDKDSSVAKGSGVKDKNKDKDDTLPGSVRRVERETGGQVLKAQPIQRDGREVYRVKVVTPQGRVRVMEDDAGPPPRPAPPPVEHDRHR